MPKKSKLRAEWGNILPQQEAKRITIRLEMKPWRCRFCNSSLVRFSSLNGLRVHIATRHPLLSKGDLRDLEPPSALKGFSVSFVTKKEWTQVKEVAKRKESEPPKMDGQNNGKMPHGGSVLVSLKANGPL